MLSASALNEYDLVSPLWFGSGSSAAFTALSAGPATPAEQINEWIVRLTPEGAEQAGGVDGAAGVLGDLGFAYHVASGLGLPGQVLIMTSGASAALVRQAFQVHAAVAYAGLNATISGGANPDENDYDQGRLFGLNISLASGVGNFPAIDSDIDAPEAWDTTKGSSSIVVAVLDSGVDYNHEDLAGNIASGGYGYDFYGYSTGGGDSDPMDDHGHGTHVAGIIGAEGDNGRGVVGVNWDVSLLPIRVLGPNNSGDIADAIAGIQYVAGLAAGMNMVTGQAIAPVNVRVINASWSVAGQFVEQDVKTMLVQAIQAAGAADILVVAAAGNGDILNNALDLNNASSLPATIERDQAVTLDNLIVVAASDPYDRLTYFSNYGAGVVDLAAPGDDILSTLPNNDYGYRDGTSMAAPFVSGVAALVLANPNQADLSAAEVKKAILGSVDRLATAEDRAKVANGGRLNAEEALDYTAFAPRVLVQSAPNIVTPGAATHSITLRYRGKTAITTSTIGLDDIVVRKGADGVPLTIQGVSSAIVGGDSKVVDATYVIAGPGDGVWNGADNGDYYIEIVAGSVSDASAGTDAQVFAEAFSVNITLGVFRVQRNDDFRDLNPGDGIPQIDGPPGSGFTLRGALQEANLVPGAVILVPAGTYTLTPGGQGSTELTSGDLNVTGQVTIIRDGPGEVIINAAQTLADRIIDVHPSATMMLEGITITGGNLTGADGGGIRNLGTSTLKKSTVQNNATDQNGGGVFNTGSLTVIESTISDNIAAINGGGIFNADGGHAEVEASTIANNAATGNAVFEFREDGPAFRVSTTTGGARRDPRIAFNSLGQAVVVWTDLSAANSVVYGQKLNPDGTKDGPQFPLNSAHAGNVELPDVALNDDGSFGAIFDVYFGAPNGADIGFRGFDWGGSGLAPTATTPTTVQQTESPDHQFRSRIIPTSDGNYLLVWTGNDGSGSGVMARRVDRNGNAGAIYPITGLGNQWPFGLARWSTGEILVTYHEQTGDGTYDVYGQRLTGMGDLQGEPFPLNATTAGDQQHADVSVTENGFVAAWYGSNGVSARIFNKSGTALTATDIPVSSQPPNGFRSVSVASLPDGSFVVVWGEVTQPGLNINHVYMRRFDGSGAAIGETQTITSTSTFSFAGPTIRVDSAGRGYVLWDGQALGDSSGIVAQRFLLINEPTGLGGGVYNAGTLNATNVTISGNEAADQGGGIYNTASGVANVNSASITENRSVEQIVQVLDPTFGGDGIVTRNLGPGASSENARDLRIQPDGKIVVVGSVYNGSDFDFALVRYNADGTPDSAFGVGGVVRTDFGSGSSDEAWNVAVQADGKIIAAGYRQIGTDYDFALARYNVDGTLDATFGGGRVITAFNLTPQGRDEVRGVAIDENGRIVVAGYCSTPNGYAFAVARYTSNGSLDNSFDGDGKLTTPALQAGAGSEANDVVIHNGKIIAAGHSDNNFWIVRYLENGSLDASFDGDGISVTDFGFVDWANDVAVQADDKIMVVGFRKSGDDWDFALARYEANGALDASFGGDGKATTSFGAGVDIANSVTLQADGRIVVGGESQQAGTDYDFAFARYNSDGSLDASFGADGKLTTAIGPAGDSAYSVALQTDGKIVAAGIHDAGGHGDFAVTRYGVSSSGVGVYNAGGGSVTLKNTIVASSIAAGRGLDVIGTFTSGGGNLIGNVGSATGLLHGANGNKVGNSVAPIDPKLGPLADNGGPTKTHHPAADSPAIDAGVTMGSPTVDQRGVVRKDTLGMPIVDGDNNGTAAIDIGAVESYFASISGKKFHDRNGDGIQDANEEGLAGWTIFLDLDPDGAGPLTRNGRRDASEPSVVTATDDLSTIGVNEAGDYKLLGLTPGEYTVAEVSQAGWERTHIDTSWVQELKDNVGGVDGLSGAAAMATAVNGRFVYIAGADEAEIARFERDAATGQLTYRGVTTTTQMVFGGNVLQSANQLAVGTLATGAAYLYALSPNGALTVFSIDTNNGDLNFSEVLRENEVHGTPPAIQGMIGASGLAVSPDGNRVYVSNNQGNAPNGGTLFVFERVGTELRRRNRLVNSPGFVQGAGGRGVAVSPDLLGNYVFVAGVADNVPGAPATLAVFERTAGSPYISFRSIVRNNENDSAGNLVASLQGTYDIEVSPDGKYVYVSAAGDPAMEGDGFITVLEVNSTADTLTLVQSLTTGSIDYLGSVVSGLEQASAITMSLDGERVYVAGKQINRTDPFNEYEEGTLTVFRRESDSGRLSFLEKIVPGIPDAYGSLVENLFATSALVSPDAQFLYVASGDPDNAVTVLRRDTEGRDAVTLEVGEARIGVNFSNRALPGAIYGLVYENRNGDLDQDVDEPALPGWEVYLDLNNNGVRESFERSEKTDSTGVYAFEGIDAATQYKVRLVPRSGWLVTAPNAPNDFHQVFVAPGQAALKNDFGVTLVSPVGAGTGSLVGLIFQDNDSDGVQDPIGEPGIAGIRVFMDLDQDGVKDGNEPSTLTSSGVDVGRYTFANVPDTPFAIRVDPADPALASRRIVAPLGNALAQEDYGLGDSVNPTRIVTADFNLDEAPDLAVLTLDGFVSIFLNDGAGQFQRFVPGLPQLLHADSLAVGDFNGDGRPDLAVASSTAYRIAIAMNTLGTPGGPLSFSNYHVITTSLTNWDIVAANFDGDDQNKADLALAQRAASPTSPSKVLILHSTTIGPTPSFAMRPGIGVGRQPRSLRVADVDGAGGEDLILVNQSTIDHSLQVLLKVGSSFIAQTAIPVPVTAENDTPFTLAVGHFNDDTKLDFLVGNSHTTAVSLYLSINNSNYGPGGYMLFNNKSFDVLGRPREILAVDIDGDADLDILAGTVNPKGVTAGLTILRNIGTASTPKFAEPEVKGVAVVHTGDLPGVKSLVVGDFTRNGGLPDIAAVTGKIDGGSLAVFDNSTITGAHRVAVTGGSTASDLNFALAPIRQLGDFDADRDVDGADFLKWQRGLGIASGATAGQGDGDGDGDVDGADLAVWRSHFSQSAMEAALGDYDADGDADGFDFLKWQRGLGIASGASVSQGDGDGDGDVDGADLAIWRSHFGESSVEAAFSAALIVQDNPATEAVLASEPTPSASDATLSQRNWFVTDRAFAEAWATSRGGRRESLVRMRYHEPIRGPWRATTVDDWTPASSHRVDGGSGTRREALNQDGGAPDLAGIDLAFAKLADALLIENISAKDLMTL